MDNYQTFIAKSRYARYIDGKKRRESWEESVCRYIDFMEEHLKSKYGHSIPNKERLRQAIVNLEVLPSMRAIMTAGPALARDNTAAFNCSYLPVDDPKSFDEAMFILLCGTGVGFSVEQQYVNQLPEVPEKMFNSATVIHVKDSKEGWAKSLRQLIALLYSGEIPKWDTSRVRPAGARLKTFGGRASGSAPLEDLFQFVTTIFTKAAGRKLTTLECHDIMCKIADVVVVGGVRRSAMISLSDLGDDKMRHAKTGAWWEAHPHRALANNSACYNERPEVGTFMEEWNSLYNSKSGERGIFNREAAKLITAERGKRDPNWEFGTNPCSEIILRPYQFCNLTEVVVRAEDTKESLMEKVELATQLGTYQSTLTYFPYLSRAWKRNTEEERLLGVSLSGIFDNPLTYSGGGEFLDVLRNKATEVNNVFAEELAIPASAAITCVKPSGTVSQLADCASGIHPRHSAFYIRRVRQDNKDPLTQFMKDKGFPWEPCYLKPDSTTVFSFPKKAPDSASLREDISAVDHLKVWLTYQNHYCDHKPSVTISVSEHEWPEVGAFVWKHFDRMSGVSFLPYDGGSYKQAPYEECSEEVYLEALEKMPKNINWEELVETDDNVEGVQTLSCSAGTCEL